MIPSFVARLKSPCSELLNPEVAALGYCVQQCKSAIARVAEFDGTTRLWQCGEASIRAGDGLNEAAVARLGASDPKLNQRAFFPRSFDIR